MKHTYIAMTTHNFQASGYNMILVAGNKKADVEAKAREIIGDPTTIYKDTEQKNLIVVSKTKAKREFGFDYNEFYPDCRNPSERFVII